MYHQKYHQFQTFYNHKFGFHITGPHQGAFDEVLRLKPKVVKTLDFSVDVMKRIRETIPDVFLIGRLFVHPQDFGQLSGGTIQMAQQRGREMAERILREEVNRDIHHINGEPVFHAWESLNEVFPESTSEETQKLYEEYQIAFGEKMLAAGFEPVAFNFSQGNGRGEQWLRLYPGTLELYKYLGFHEYDWPTMDRLHKIGLDGPDEPENRVPGAGEGRGNDGMWRCLRYRRVMNEGIRQKYGDKHTLIITECGMTQGVWGGPSLDIGPWAHEVSVPRDIPGGVVESPIPVDDYWRTLQWYNSELMKDDYVMGACLFVTGASGLPEWETFEHLETITPRILAFQREVPLDTIATTTTPVSSPPAPDLPPPPPPAEIPLPPALDLPASATAAPPPSGMEEWQFAMAQEYIGLPIFAGDIGLPNEPVTITWPDESRETVLSGSQSEHGPGGFEVLADLPGLYRVEFRGQSFLFDLTGQFTRVIFREGEVVPPPSIPMPPTFDDDDTEPPFSTIPSSTTPVDTPPTPPKLPVSDIAAPPEVPPVPTQVPTPGLSAPEVPPPPTPTNPFVADPPAPVEVAAPEHLTIEPPPVVESLGGPVVEPVSESPAVAVPLPEPEVFVEEVAPLPEPEPAPKPVERRSKPPQLRATVRAKQPQSSYPVRTPIEFTVSVTNVGNTFAAVGMIGLLVDDKAFSPVSEQAVTIRPGRTFGVTVDFGIAQVGTYTLYVALCTASTAQCAGSDSGWMRFEPGLTITVV